MNNAQMKNIKCGGILVGSKREKGTMDYFMKAGLGHKFINNKCMCDHMKNVSINQVRLVCNIWLLKYFPLWRWSSSSLIWEPMDNAGCGCRFFHFLHAIRLINKNFKSEKMTCLLLANTPRRFCHFLVRTNISGKEYCKGAQERYLHGSQVVICCSLISSLGCFRSIFSILISSTSCRVYFFNNCGNIYICMTNYK